MISAGSSQKKITITSPKADAVLRRCSTNNLDFNGVGATTPVDISIVDSTGKEVKKLATAYDKLALQYNLDDNLKTGTYSMRIAVSATASAADAKCISGAAQACSFHHFLGQLIVDECRLPPSLPPTARA